ncbi:hypothetical protein CEP54_007327 [Fusarium duplospermum]|uniref:Prion-inhibition and propagation HeLo domain-containing protein n=1 Tax=Fusarium duplospermum TaxID=1325734 RepID=A0A428Q240_9HYPO|nr:hypothetical protein CEP54_007327 [Fusarium duplospermum]
MTEIFGAVSGAISVAALFNNCVDCFEYIQFARRFGKDYGTCQLRLDVAKWRLDRWGAAININNDSRFRSDAPVDNSVARARSILQDIVGKIGEACKISQTYEPTPDYDREIFTRADMDPASQRLRDQYETITKKRQDRTSLLKKTRWALYDKKLLGDLISNIVSSTRELEEVFPSVLQASMQLARAEIGQVDNQQSLRLMQDVASGPDPVLRDLAKQRLAGVEVQNSAIRVKTAESGKMGVGDNFTREAFGQSVGFPYRATNHVEDMEVGGDSKVHVGDNFGGKGFWD